MSCHHPLPVYGDTLTNTVAFRLVNVRKTYGVRHIPQRLFRECRLSSEQKPREHDWRAVCGSHAVCRSECPRCWTLWMQDMRILRGKTTAILGHSGSGKTTLLYTLALLHEPDSDSERFDITCLNQGQPVSMTYREQSWRMASGARIMPDTIRKRYFGFIFQAGHLTSTLTAMQNVALPLALAGVDAKTIRDTTAELFARIHFPTERCRALPRHLSGGEYQRVAVARALAHAPQVVFADEPTGNLDPVTGNLVMKLLTTWRQEGEEDRSRTLILVTHNIEYALEYCDHIFVLAGGRITHETVKEKTSRKEIEKYLQM